MTGTYTFLLTDIEGSTSLVRSLRDRYGDVLAEHHRVLRGIFEDGGGEGIGTQGDAFFVAFRRPKDAVEAAVAGQRALVGHEWPHGVQPRVRMGIHTGDASITAEEYHGLAVHRAARICAAGQGGQILVSQATHALLEDEEHVFLDLGEQQLKDFERPVRIYELMLPDATAPATPSCVRVLIVDDQALVRAGFRMILEAESDMEVAGEAADGRAAVDEARRLRPDVVLMDVRMPELDGIEATRMLLAQDDADTRVVMLTTFDMDEYVYEALRAGASGFLLKDVPPEQLVEGIRAVASGDALLAPSITRRVIEEFVSRPPGAARTPPPEVEELTPRESEVLTLLARGRSNAEIAEELVVSETTVKTHVAHVLTKLGLRDRVQAVVFAYESGLVEPGRGVGMLRVAAVAVVVFGVAGLPSASAQPEREDYAALALNVLPPGQNGSLVFDRNTTDQAQLYECLTPLFDRVQAEDLRRCFKDASLGMNGKPARVQRPRKGVVIERDRWGVPHITGKTAADVAFGAGWVTVEDRGLLLELIRGPARAAALDIPGISPVELALSGKQFVPSAQGEAELSRQLGLVRKAGARGKRLLTVVQAYVAGLNASLKKRGLLFNPYTTRDVVAVAALLTARFGANGGSEIRRAMFLDALQKKLGKATGRAVFDDLRAADDGETPTIGPGRFAYQLPPATAPGSVVIDDGSFQPAAISGTVSRGSQAASNALLVGAKRSKTGHPILVGGPQVGYFFPQFFMEVDLHGGGYDARGALLPGLPFVVIGRGPDYAWTVTSSQSDNIDVFAESLCGDDRHYLHQGSCREMTSLDAGTLRSTGAPDQRLNLRQTVHGPVLGYATVGGTRVALSVKRSTRGREVLSGLPILALNTGQVTSAKRFVSTAVTVEGMFNFFYVDDRDIAHATAGRLPIRPQGTDPALPTVGTGEFEWRGFLGAKAHPQTVNPASGAILDWNSRPAAGWGAADDNWSYGSVQRKDLLTVALGPGKKSVAEVVAASNKAATQDLRVMEVWPAIADVLATGPAPTTLARTAADLLTAWRAAGGSRLDRDLDGRIDHPGAAIMDAAWPLFARAVMRPVLGDLVERLAQLHVVSDDAGTQGSAYIDGWYGYVEKDLRALLGRRVQDPYSTRYCGRGDVDACRESLWAAVTEASATLTAKHTSDPATWWANARAERINFTTGLLTDTLAWTNRPTFQQVMSFDSHRRR